MLTIRTAGQIRWAQHLKGFRSCAASTGVPLAFSAARRVLQAEASLTNSELRRQWLARQWQAHQARVRRH